MKKFKDGELNLARNETKDKAGELPDYNKNRKHSQYDATVGKQSQFQQFIANVDSPTRPSTTSQPKNN